MSDASHLLFCLEGQQCISLFGTPRCHVPGYLQVQDHYHEVKCLSAWLLKSKFWQLKELSHTACLLPWHTIHKDNLDEIFTFPCQSLLLVLFVHSLHSIKPHPWKCLGVTCHHCPWKLSSKSHLWDLFHQPPF